MVSDADVRRQGEAQLCDDKVITAAIKIANEDPKLTAVEAITKAQGQAQAQSQEKSTTTTKSK